MTAHAALLSHPLTEVLGWTLLHSLWQLTLVATLLLLALRRLPLTRPRLRYGLACAALGAMMLIPVAAFVWLSPSAGVTDSVSLTATAPTVAGGTSGSLSQEADLHTSPQSESAIRMQDLAQRLMPGPLLPWLVILWLVGALVQASRLAGGLLVMHHLKNKTIRLAPQSLQATLIHLSRGLGIKKQVRLFSSALVQVPIVIGWLRPVILVPASAVTGLTTTQLEVLVAHELAHIRRHDYLVNLLQSVVETLLFYHPAVWWVSGEVHREREHCCDDLAIVLCGGDRVIYAKALVNLEAIRAHAHHLALAANGGPLLNRIKRIAHQPVPPTATPAPWSAATLFLLLGFVFSWLAFTPGLARVQSEVPVQKRVVIDPGHSSKFPGAVSNDGTLREEDLVLDIAFRLRALLVARGIEVILTRSGAEPLADTFEEDAAARASLASADTDLFLSIHASASKQPDLRGVSTWFYGTTAEPNRGTPSAVLAETLQEHLTGATAAYDRSVRRVREAPLLALREVRAPAALVEVGFLTHLKEAARLATREYQDILATAMAEAVIQFLSNGAAAVTPGDPYPLVPTQPPSHATSPLRPGSANAARPGDLVSVDVAGAAFQEAADWVRTVGPPQATTVAGRF